MKRPNRLSATFVDKVTVPGRYGDGRGGHGLSVLVKPTKSGGLSKTYAQRLTIAGKAVNVGLGAHPIVSLAAARSKALENRRAIARGEDPRRPSVVPTLAEAAKAVIALRAPGWRNGRSADQWRSSLGTHVLPILGDRLVDDITAADLLGCLGKHWHERPETARRLLQRLGRIMEWAVTQGHRPDNPAVAVRAALPRHNSEPDHHAALHHSALADALRAIRDSDASEASKLCFEFMVLTAARSGEARGATWDEIDTNAAIWTIPGDRMKSGRTHRVPLATHAVTILQAARSCLAGTDLVFASPTTGRTLSDNTLSKITRSLELGFTPHGCRSTFRDWCGETGIVREVAEHCLAHTVRGVEGAYARSDLLERRRPVMQQWADHLQHGRSVPNADTGC